MFSFGHAAYFGIGQYADPATFVDGEPAQRACTPTNTFGDLAFTPEWPPASALPPQIEE